MLGLISKMMLLGLAAGSRRTRIRAHNYEVKFIKSQEDINYNVNINDYVHFKCSHEDIVNVYLVSSDGYNNCMVTDEDKIVLDCTGPDDANKETEFKIVEFSPMVFAYLFKPGHEYYYIGRSGTAKDYDCDTHTRVKLTVGRRQTHPPRRRSKSTTTTILITSSMATAKIDPINQPNKNVEHLSSKTEMKADPQPSVGFLSSTRSSSKQLRCSAYLTILVPSYLSYRFLRG